MYTMNKQHMCACKYFVDQENIGAISTDDVRDLLSHVAQNYRFTFKICILFRYFSALFSFWLLVFYRRKLFVRFAQAVNFVLCIGA